MSRTSRSRRQGKGGWYAQAVGLVRPGAEAILLAGVALGCAQIGWRFVSPKPTDSSADPISPTLTAAAQPVEALRSPFAPLAREPSAPSNSALVALSTVHLVGVRMSELPERSGAVLNLGDGVQRPFMVGFEIVNGVRLAEVASDHIVVSYDEGEQTIMMDRPAQPGSFALALMGAPDQRLALTSNTPVIATKESLAKTVSFHPANNSPDNVQWLVSTMANIETRNGAPYAWRVATPPPATSPDTGLRAGDLILTANGMAPGNSSLAKLASAARIQLAVERPSGERVTVTFENSVPS